MDQPAFAIWRSTFSVGHSVLDGQHRRILTLLNDLYEACRSTVDKEQIESILETLSAYSVRHLAYEEKILQEIGYPELEAHRNIHRNFLSESSAFSGAMLRGEDEEDVAREMLDFLRRWWTDHIQHTDRLYIPYLKSQSGR